MKKSIYNIITDTIIEKLNEGIVPWQKPWKNGFAKNLISGKEYRGINAFLLNLKNYPSEYWITFKQAKAQNGNIKKGEVGTPVIFWNWIEKDKKNDKEETEKKNIPFVLYYIVFNITQCEGIEVPASNNEIIFEPIHECEKVIDDMPNKPKIQNGNPGKVFYSATLDKISIPVAEKFIQIEKYYSTLFHEIVHSTGHKNRLNRLESVGLCPFGSTDYSKEELIAEMGASFLAGHTGIENKTIDNSAAYIQSWLKVLKNDKKMIISAAASAQKAVDFIINAREEI